MSCPAVVLPFGTSPSETTEVVPADYVAEENNFSVYEIPDCDGGWMRASPDAHNAFVRQLDQRLGGKLKPLIRFVKAWKCYRQVPISSFYIELRVANFMRDDSSIIYDIDLNTVFRKLYDCGLTVMQDPMGISGHIPAAKSAARLADARSKLETAATRAEKARAAALRGATAEAFGWWRLLFDDNFPSYYY